jgi:isoleucyl-tRNA synthetase
VTLRAEGETLARLRAAAPELPALFIVSGVDLAEGPLQVAVARAPGKKCERCWVWSEDVGTAAAHPTICGKCAAALG